MRHSQEREHLLPSEIILAMPELSLTASTAMTVSPNSSKRVTADASNSPANAIPYSSSNFTLRRVKHRDIYVWRPFISKRTRFSYPPTPPHPVYNHIIPADKPFCRLLAGNSPVGSVIMALHCAAFTMVLILVTASSSCLDCSGAGIPRCHAAAPKPSIATLPIFLGPLQMIMHPTSCCCQISVHLGLPSTMHCL